MNNIEQMSSNNTNYTRFLGMLEKLQKLTETNSEGMIKLKLIQYIYPSLFIIGILGNFLCLWLMIKTYKKERRENRNFSFCFSMICCADLSVLLFGALREYLEVVLDVKIRSHSKLTCKFIFFGVYLFSAFSSYLYAFIAV
jgi:hypothetical protein